VHVRPGTGLVSVTFRKLSPRQVVEWTAQAGLEAVEWGGDIHVPAGDEAAAREVARITREAGLRVAAYGSYCRLGATGTPFEAALKSARALGAPLIRVWAGAEGSVEAGEAGFRDVAAAAEAAAALARSEGMRLGLEYHAGTLTDTPASTARLLEAVEDPALVSFWQPPVGLSKGACLEGLNALVRRGRLGSLHVFHWWPDAQNRRPLAEGEDAWRTYLAAARSAPGGRDYCLEFVRDDDPGMGLEDAAVLRRWLED